MIKGSLDPENGAYPIRIKDYISAAWLDSVFVLLLDYHKGGRTCMDEDRQKLIGERVRLAREQKGYSQAELGAHVEISETEIRKIEQGEFPAELCVLLGISAILECSIDYLIGSDNGDLKPDEAELLQMYRTLPHGLPRDYLLKFLKSWSQQRGFGQNS